MDSVSTLNKGCSSCKHYWQWTNRISVLACNNNLCMHEKHQVIVDHPKAGKIKHWGDIMVLNANNECPRYESTPTLKETFKNIHLRFLKTFNK